MSDDLRSSLRAWQLQNMGGSPGNPHDALHEQSGADSLRHLSSHPFSLEPHEVSSFPPLIPRTKTQLEDMPPQPAAHADPWDWMKLPENIVHDVAQEGSALWHSKQHSLGGKLWNSLSLPSHAFAHQLALATHMPDAPHQDLMTQTVDALTKGYDPQQHYTATNWAVWGAADLAGLGASILTDPLTYTSLGPEAKAAEALNILKRPIEAIPAALRETAERAVPAIRRGIGLTPENIRYAASVMEQERLGKAAHAAWTDLKKAGQDPAELEQGLLNMQKVWTEQARPTWEAALNKARGELKTTPLGVSHPAITESKLPATWAEYTQGANGQALTAEEQLTHLARRQALTEAQIEHGKPMLRFARMRTPIPSPLPVIGRVASRLGGVWKPAEAIGVTNGAKAAMLDKGAPAYAAAGGTPVTGEGWLDANHLLFADAAQDGVDPANLNVAQTYDRLMGMQAGKSSTLEGGLLTGEQANKWARDWVLSFPTVPERQRAAAAVVNLYGGIAHTLAGVQGKAPLEGIQHAFVPNQLEELQGTTHGLRKFLSGKEMQDAIADAPAKVVITPEMRAESIWEGMTGAAREQVFGVNAPQASAKVPWSSLSDADKQMVVEHTKPKLGPNQPTTILQGGTVRKTWQTLAREKRQAAYDFVHKTLSGANADLQALELAQHADDPQVLMDALKPMLEHAQTVGSEKVQAAFHDLLSSTDNELSSRTPSSVIQSHWADWTDAQKKGRQLQAELQGFNELMRKYQGHQYGSAVNLLAAFKQPHWETILKTMGGLHLPAIEPAEVQELEALGFQNPDAITKMMNTAAATGKNKEGVVFGPGPQGVEAMTDFLKGKLIAQTEREEAAGAVRHGATQELQDFLGKLDYRHFYHLADFLHDVAGLRSDLRAPMKALEDLGLDGTARWIQRLGTQERATFERMQLPFETALPAMQWVHSPSMLGRLYARHLEPIVNAALRYAGWPQRVVEAANQYEGQLHMGDYMAVKGGRGLPGAMKYGQEDLQAVAAAHNIPWSPQTRETMDTALTKIWDNERAILNPEVEAGLRQDLEAGHLSRYNQGLYQKRLEVSDKAKALVAEGKAALAPLLPEDQMPALLKDAQDAMQTHHEAMLVPERAAGQRVVEMGKKLENGVLRSDYLHRNLIGKPKDIEAYRQALKEQYAKEAAIQGTPVITARAGYEHHRGFGSWAEEQVAIDSINKARMAAGQKPFDVAVNPSLTGRLAARYQLHHRAMATRDFIDALGAHLPGHVLGFMPGKNGGVADPEKLAALAKAHNMVELTAIPELKGWYVNPKLQEWLKGMAGMENPAEGWAQAYNTLTFPARRLMQLLKHVNTSFSGVHIKNAMSESLTTGGARSLRRAADLIGQAFKDAVGKGYYKQDGLLSPMSPIARALNEMPLAKIGVENGAFRLGHEYNLPLQDIVRYQMAAPSIPGRLWHALKHQVGPLNVATFDVMDKALRMAMMEDYIRQGFTGARAAEIANHKMVDYSMRYLSPAYRQLAKGMLYFPAWTLGTLAVHGRNIVENPAWYATLALAAQEISAQHGGDTGHELPLTLAGSVAMGHTQPGTMNKVWVRPEWPWQAAVNAVRQTADEAAAGHYPAAAYILPHYAAMHLSPLMQWGGQLMSTLGGLKQLEKRSLADVILGQKNKPSDTGLLGSLLWGTSALGLPEVFKALLDPSQWHHVPQAVQESNLPGVNTRGWLENLFTRTVQRTPQGKIIY